MRNKLNYQQTKNRGSPVPRWLNKLLSHMKYHIRCKSDGILYTIQKNLIMGLYRRLL